MLSRQRGAVTFTSSWHRPDGAPRKAVGALAPPAGLAGPHMCATGTRLHPTPLQALLEKGLALKLRPIGAFGRLALTLRVKTKRLSAYSHRLKWGLKANRMPAGAFSFPCIWPGSAVGSMCSIMLDCCLIARLWPANAVTRALRATASKAALRCGGPTGAAGLRGCVFPLCPDRAAKKPSPGKPSWISRGRPKPYGPEKATGSYAENALAQVSRETPFCGV